MTFTATAWFEQYMAGRAEDERNATAQIAELLPKLFEIEPEAQEITWSYYGSGDSGEITDVDAGIELSPDGALIAEEITNQIYDLLPTGWEINEGSSGSITAKRGEKKLEHKHHWLEYVDALLPDIELE